MIGKVKRYIKRKIRRYRNQKHIADYPECSGGWTKYSGNPILGDEATGTMFDPFVRKIDGQFKMCVSRRKDDVLVMYTSEDGIHLKDAAEILKGSDETQWDAKVNRGCFLIRNGQWYLWYTGQNNNESRIGLAVSKDGSHFDRVSDRPVLVPEKEYEGTAVMNPCVMWDDEKKIFRMWYAAGENYEPDVIGYAESSDGVVWKKYPEPLIRKDETIKYRCFKVGACDVIKTADGKHLMVYIVYQNLDVSRIAMAVSDDGIHHWHDVSDLPILSPGEGKWDGHAVYKPTICYDEEKDILNLWYNGRLGTYERIGMASLKKPFLMNKE